MSSYIRDSYRIYRSFFFFQAEDGIRDLTVTGVQTCALPISAARRRDRCRSRRTGETGRAAARSPGAPPPTSLSSPHDGELLSDHARAERRAGRAREPHAGVRPDPRVRPFEEGHLVGAVAPLQQVAAFGLGFDEHFVRRADQAHVLVARPAPHGRAEAL